MTTIDFTRIRSAPKSRNDSFEALAVQLFHGSCPIPADSTFVSLRGEGGDGGVEAYFRTPDGSIVGVQAKYFFQLGSDELVQIDDSLKTALTNHPSLSEYWVYIPFDLTGRVAAGKRGKSQAERYEEWKSKVESEASAHGAKIAIKLCPAAIIRRQLLDQDPHGGLRRYWFDDSILALSQIQHCLDEAAAFAGPRYTSALDVVTDAHIGLDIFGGIGDFPAWAEEVLAPTVANLRALIRRGQKAFNILGEPAASTGPVLIRKIIAMSESVVSVALIAAVAEIRSALCTLLPILAELREAQEQAFYNKHGQEYDTPGFRQFSAEYQCTFPAEEMDVARELEDVAVELQAILTSQEMGAAATRSLLLIGPAGIGKTHAIVSAACRRLSHGGYSLVVFGDDFGKAEPWEVIRSKLGFGALVDRHSLFESLQACAEHTGLPFVIYIDALNESPRNARWRDKLPELLAQCKPYADVKICVSTRDTYRDLVVDSRFPGFAFEHVGFAGQEFEAVQAFASHYGLDAEITPLFSPELNNPLFLHLACKTLKEEGRNSLDMSLPGFAALLERHLKHCDVSVRARLHYSNPRNLVRAAMLRLAEILTQIEPKARTWDACTAVLSGLTGSEASPEALLKELEHEGLIILSVAEGDSWLVRLGYQRYGDILRAASFVESIDEPSGLGKNELASKLSAFSMEDEGLLEALAAVLPEKTGMEITSNELGLDPPFAHRLFINALPWRSRASVTYSVDEHVYGALYTPNLWQQVYEVFFRLSLVPNHRLNAEKWLSLFLQRSSLVNRDAFLTVAAFKSFDNKGAVWSLINAALRADIHRWPTESRRLAVFVLAWLTSCANRRVRDLAAKGMTRILAGYPEIAPQLVDEFQYCDDDYISESISLAIYSACLLERERRKDFLPALDRLLSAGFNTENILVRDSVQLLARFLSDLIVAGPLAKRVSDFAQKAPAPHAWPTLEEAKPLLELEGLPSNMKLWGSELGPDFWRYQVQPRIRAFDTANAKITNENMACWLMLETLKLGYPGANGCALHFDRVLSGQFGTGRSRESFIERLGKKYCWIALHRLIGILADNVAPKKEPFSDWVPSPAHLWSVDLRKADLTDVRDINLSDGYPDTLLEGPRYHFPDHTSNIPQWVRLDDITPHEACIIRALPNGEEWVALSLDAADNDRNPNDDAWASPYLAVRLHYTSVFVKGSGVTSSVGEKIREAFESQGASSYRSYLAEYPDSPVFDQFADEGRFDRGSRHVDFTTVRLARGGEWGYDYSYLTPERQEHLEVPCQGIVNVLDLRWDKHRGWVNHEGKLTVFEAQVKHRKAVFIRRSSLNDYISATGQKLIYQRFVNRGLFDLKGGDGSQIDLLDWLLYRPEGTLKILKKEARPFNC